MFGIMVVRLARLLLQMLRRMCIYFHCYYAGCMITNISFSRVVFILLLLLFHGIYSSSKLRAAGDILVFFKTSVRHLVRHLELAVNSLQRLYLYMTQVKREHRYLEWDSNLRAQYLSGQELSLPYYITKNAL